jgi:drug/metabolite transporter (DMT)-like permease
MRMSEPAPTATARNVALGAVAALAAALLGSSWQIASRHGVTTSLGPLELALLRYGVPTLLLAPWWLLRSRPRTGPPRRLPPLALAVAIAGGGLPFGLLALGGAQWAPAAHMGIFMAGAMPVFTALGAWLVLREPLSRLRCAGLVLTAGGVLALMGDGLTATADAWRGDLLFLLAAVCWAAHSLAFRRCGLSPWEGAALINACSLLALLPLIWFNGLPRLRTVAVSELALQTAVQGVVAGVLGLVVYLEAVRRLGAARASLSGALVPVLTTLGAAALLSEAPTPFTWLALLFVVGGVVLASGLRNR